MKKVLFFISLIPSLGFACPTCVGRINPQSPPYFSQDFYQPHQVKDSQLDQELKERIKQWTQNSDIKEVVHNDEKSEEL